MSVEGIPTHVEEAGSVVWEAALVVLLSSTVGVGEAQALGVPALVLRHE